jgi:glyoxylase-like metal-dependent hydrolase (beta-lactamase superfamily II)
LHDGARHVAANNIFGESVMKQVAIALAAMLACGGSAMAQQPIDFAQIGIKTIDLGKSTYRLEGAGGNVTVAVGSDGIIVVDSQYAPLYDKIKAAIASVSPLPVKYVIATHYHGDHTGGVERFQADGATGVAQDNIRVRLAAGTTNGITGAKTPPRPEAGIPKQTYVGGSTTVEAGGRKALLTHVNNAHTDGDTFVYFADANVLATGDLMSNTKRYQSIDFANGGDIRGVIKAMDALLAVSNAETKVVTGHGAPATRADIEEYRAMLVVANARVEKLFNEGKSEADVMAASPLKDLDAKWAANDTAAAAFLKMVYNSYKRS